MKIEEEEKEEVKEEQKKSKEPKKGFVGYDLPPVALRKGGMGEFDQDILKQQQYAILNGLNQMDQELSEIEKNKSDDLFDGKTMQ